MKKPSQSSFAAAGFEAFRKPTRRERFLAEMDRVVPWGQLCGLVRPGAGHPCHRPCEAQAFAAVIERDRARWTKIERETGVRTD